LAVAGGVLLVDSLFQMATGQSPFDYGVIPSDFFPRPMYSREKEPGLFWASVMIQIAVGLVLLWWGWKHAHAA
jgi:hypothetical protein